MIGLSVSPRPWALHDQRAAETQTVSAGLFLKYPPRPRGTTLRRFQVRSQRRPLNAALDAHYASFVVEGDDTIQATRIDQQGVLGELLTSHGMSAAGDGNSLAGWPELESARHCSASAVRGLTISETRVGLSCE